MKEPLPAIRNGWIRILLFLLAYVLCITGIGTFLGVMILAKQGGATPETMSGITMKILVLNALVSLLLVSLFRVLIDKKTVPSLGLVPFTKDALLGLLVAVAIMGAGTLILFANGNLQWTDYSFDAGNFFLMFGFMLLIAFGEEMVFRGYILNNLLTVTNKWTALAGSALLFAAVHVSNAGINVVSVFNLFVAGLLLGLNYIYTKNLWFSIIFHFSWNFIQGPVLGYEVSGLDVNSVLQPELSGNPLITGDTFGFEGSLISTVLSLITIMLLYLAFEKRSSDKQTEKTPATRGVTGGNPSNRK